MLVYFYTASSGRFRPFCIFIRCESCKWRPPAVALWDLRENIKILALLGQSVIMLVPSVVLTQQQPGTIEHYNNRRQSMCP